MERFYSLGPSSRLSPASPHQIFLKGGRELLQAGGGQGTGRGCLPLSARNSALNSLLGRSSPVPIVISGKGWGWKSAVGRSCFPKHGHGLPVSPVQEAAGAGQAPGRAQPQGDCKIFFRAWTKTQAFCNQLLSRGQKTRLVSDFFSAAIEPTSLHITSVAGCQELGAPSSEAGGHSMRPWGENPWGRDEIGMQTCSGHASQCCLTVLTRLTFPL